ncbi:hypothetical protein GGU11DRAFT_366974 [Lentinula aff. detonsa]|nr:hypothetical protein GGU11DRAFT_366974 [Lentinula aff. detonsa]
MNAAWRSIFLQKHREDRLPETTAALAQPNSSLNEFQYDMVDCDQAVSRAELSSTGLKATRTKSESHSMTCLVRILPADILAEIFSMICLGDYSLKINRPGPLSKESFLSSPTLVLTQICSYWRSLVFSLPLLWSSLSIESRHLYGRPALASLVVAYISRSGSVPLTFQLKSDDDAPEVELQVFDALLEHASRWQKATLLVSSPWLLRAKTKLDSRLVPGSICFPKLEHLVLDVQRDSRFDKDVMYLPSQIIQSSPRLNTFHGLGYDFLLRARGFGNSYGNQSLVTKLVLHRFTGRSLSRLLRCFPILEIFNLGGFELAENASTHVGLEEELPLYTSRVTHLCHSAPWDTFQTGAWQSLRLPNLTSLDLRHKDYPLTELSSLLCQSGTSLTEVKLYNFPLVEILRFLSSHPSVLHLSVHVDGELRSLNQLTTGLTLATDSWSIVPHLLSFELSWNDWGYKRLRDSNTLILQTGLVNAICGMVESRLYISGSGSHGLERFALRIRDGDFLEFESLYESIDLKYSSLPTFVFETLTPPLLCDTRFP